MLGVMAEGDAGFAAQPSFITRPSHQEVLKLHRELQIWMMHTRYTMQGTDNQPLWRMHNTPLTLGNGAGIGAFFGFAKVMPKMKPLVRAIPATVLFYFTYRACQVQQLPFLYASLLSLPTPLGGKGREVLNGLRNSEGMVPLPSQEFANQMPPPADQRSPEAPSSAPSGHASSTGSPPLDPSTMPPAQSTEFFSGDSQANLPRVAAPEPDPAPHGDPWRSDAGFGGAALGGEAPGWGSDGWPAEQAPAANKQLATWDEIRARQAAAAAERK